MNIKKKSRKISAPNPIKFPLKNIDGDNFEDKDGEIVCLSEILERLRLLESNVQKKSDSNMWESY